MALHSEFGRAGIEIIGFTRHQSGKKVDSDHKSVKHGLAYWIFDQINSVVVKKIQPE